MADTTALIRRARLTEWYAKNAWGLHRLFVGKHLSKRCVRCAVSAVYSALDEQMVCTLCRTASAKPDHAAAPGLETELDRLLLQHVGKGTRSHDAVVLFSGGKDSVFLIHELKRRYPGLRLLALLVDNSFMSPLALDNAARAAEMLDVDYVPLKPARSLYKKYFRIACTHVQEGKGCFETVDMTEIYFFVSLAKTFAATNQIPLIISGLAWAQVERLYGVQSFEAPPDAELRKIEAVIGTLLTSNYHPSEERYCWHPDKYPEAARPRIIHPFYVWRFEENEIRNRVTSLGLIEPGNDSPLLTNHRVIIMMVIVDYVRIGYCSYEPDITEQIRHGTADRLYWRNIFEMTEYSAKTGWMMNKEIDKILKSLDLTRAAIGLPRG
jgi:hypothetical protein